MKVKQAVFYQMHDFLRSAKVFYAIQGSVYVALSILFGVFASGKVGSNGTEVSMFIFIFVTGLNAFKSQFHIFLQNGLSRKTHWAGFALSALILSVGITIFNELFIFVFSFFMECEPFFNVLYNSGAQTVSAIGILWTIGMSFLMINLGFFITTLYYRMNAFGKLAVSIGVPVVLFVLLPIIEGFFPSLNFFSLLVKGFVWVMGFGGVQAYPARTVLCSAVGSCILLAFSYLLMRRAITKDA